MENPRPLNHTSPSSSASPPPPLVLCPGAATLVALPCLYGVLFLTGLPGNALSLWVFLRRVADTAAPTRVYLSHLSASNLLVSLAAPFMVAYYVQAPARPAASLLCRLVLHGTTPALHVNIHLSVVLLSWLAVSRLAVLSRGPRSFAQPCRCCSCCCSPALWSRLRRASFARAVCVGAWVLVVGTTTFVTLYYSLKESGSGSGRGRVPDRGGAANHSRVWGEVEEDEEVEEEEEVVLCYSPATELGGVLSNAGQVITITLFFACFLLVLLCYVLLLVHVRRSRRDIRTAATRGLLRRVFRNIVVIKMVLIFCLLPYNVYKAIFISLVRDQGLHSYSTSAKTQHCHPVSSLIEIKNLLLLLAMMRGSLDPVMYFLLDRTFRKQTLILLGLRTQTTACEEGAAGQRPALSELGTETPTADDTL